MTATTKKPDIVFFHVDNLGYGELGCYGGGVLRGAGTKRIDAFAREGFLFWNGPRLYGVKWRSFKMALVDHRSWFDPAPDYGCARCRNLIYDPKETQPIPAGVPLDFVPKPQK